MGDLQETFHQWHHSPAHMFVPGSTYMVTAATYGKQPFFDTAAKKDLLLAELFEQTKHYGWQLEAWAILNNHYHFVGKGGENAADLSRLIKRVHSETAVRINEMDGTPGRKVWFQYWDSCLTHEKSYLARLHYVHQNPVKHRVAKDAEAYPWCSMGWFLREAEGGFRRTVLSFKCDSVNVLDDFQPLDCASSLAL